MYKKQLINKVKEIILKHANPVRIYIYGSQVNGDAQKNSDIDIAFEDETFVNMPLINQELDTLETLLKIDVKNIVGSSDRFSNRVRATGRVIYSATKKLRAEDGLYNFSNALKKFIDAINKEEELKQEGFGDIYLDLIVKRFEFTYEMSWKALKRYLAYIGLEVKNPRAVFIEGFEQELIKDESVWLEMIEQRNLSSHVYDEYEITDILDKIYDFKEAFIELEKTLQKGLTQS